MSDAMLARRVAGACASAVSPGRLALRALHATAGARGVMEDFDVLKPEPGMVTLNGVSEDGVFVNGIHFPGAVLAMPEMAVLWDVRRVEDITPESLVLVTSLKEPPEILVVGTGPRTQRLDRSVQEALRKQGTRVELMQTSRALATFNVLAMEGRSVAAALLPPLSDEDRLKAKLDAPRRKGVGENLLVQ